MLLEIKGIRLRRTVDRKDKLDVSVPKGQREEQYDKSRGKVILDMSVCSSNFEVMDSHFHTRS